MYKNTMYKPKSKFIDIRLGQTVAEPAKSGHASPGIVREQLSALFQVEFGNEDCIKSNILELHIWVRGSVCHSSNLVVAPHVFQAKLGGWLGIQAAASRSIDSNVSIAL